MSTTSRKPKPLQHCAVGRFSLLANLLHYASMNTLSKDLKYYYIVRAFLKRFIIPILPLYMLHAGLSVAQIGIIAAMAYIFALILEVPSGMVSDTLGHKKTLVLSLLGQGVGMLLYLGGDFWWIAAGSAMYFGSVAFMSGTLHALLYERLDECNHKDLYHKVLSKSKAISHVYSMIVLLFAGVAYAWQWWLPFVISAVHFAFAALAASQFTQAKQTKSVKEEEGFLRFVSHFPTAIKQLKKHNGVLWVILFNGLVIGIGFGSGDFHQVIFDNFGLAVALFGIMYSIKRLAQLIGYLTVSKLIERLPMSKFLTINVLLVIAYLIFTPFMNSPWTFIAAAALASISYAFMSIGVDNYVNLNIPSGSRATALSLSTFFRAVVMALTTLTIGFGSDYIGLENVYGVLGVFILFFFIFTRSKMTKQLQR